MLLFPCVNDFKHIHLKLIIFIGTFGLYPIEIAKKNNFFLYFLMINGKVTILLK